MFSLLLKSIDKMLDDSLHLRGVSDLCSVHPGNSMSLCPERTHSPGWLSLSHAERAHTHGFGRSVLREEKYLPPKASLGLSLFHEKNEGRVSLPGQSQGVDSLLDFWLMGLHEKLKKTSKTYKQRMSKCSSPRDADLIGLNSSAAF